MTDRNITKRSEALLAGSKFFFSGRPCVRGHVVPRYVSSGACSACLAERAENFRTDYKAARAARFSPQSGVHLVTAKVPLPLLDAFKAMCAALGVILVEPKRDKVTQTGAAFVFPAHLTPPHPASPKPEILK